MITRRVCLCLLAALAACLLGLKEANAALIANWNFDTDFSTTVGGPTYDATANNGASISAVESKWGGASAHFDSASSQYAVTTASPVPAGSFSYSCWYYLNVAQTGNPYVQYSTVATGGVGDPYTVFFNIDQDAGAPVGNSDDFIVARAKTDDVSAGPFLIAPETNHQQWINFIETASYDGGTNTTTIEGFVNGASVGSATAAGKPLASDYFAFGADRGLGSRFWEGYIDDVAVYNSVLTPGLIAALQTGPAATAAPEPATMFLVASGLFGFLSMGSRRQM